MEIFIIHSLMNINHHYVFILQNYCGRFSHLFRETKDTKPKDVY